MKPTEEKQKRKEALRIKRFEERKKQNQEKLLGYCVRDDVPSHPNLRWPITIEFWEFLHKFNLDSEEGKAQRIAFYLDLLEKAKTADAVLLKVCSDAIRNRIGEVPSVIPKRGFQDVDAMTYPECLCYEELRTRVMADMQQWGLLEMFTVAETRQQKEVRE